MPEDCTKPITDNASTNPVTESITSPNSLTSPQRNAITDFLQPVYRKTILDNIKLGDVIQIITNFDTSHGNKEPVKGQPTNSSPAAFSATCYQDQDQDLPVLDYILGKLQDETKLVQSKTLDQLDPDSLANFEEGKMVVAFDTIENAFSRYIYMEKDVSAKKATLFNIDSPKLATDIPFEKIVTAESEAYAQPALGFQFAAIGTVTPNVDQQIRGMAAKEVFEAKVLYKKLLQDGRLKSMTVALMKPNKTPLLSYKVTPYYMNPKLTKLLNVPLDSKMDGSSLKGIELHPNDQVHGLWDVAVKYGQWSDIIPVMKIQDVEKRDQLQQILQKECLNAPPIVTGKESPDVLKALRGQLVAFRSSKDEDCYYRGVITGTKPDTVRLNSVDFGYVEGTK